MKYFALFLFFMVALLTGCGQPIVVVDAQSEIHVHPSPVQAAMPRYSTVVGCTSVSAVYRYVDYGETLDDYGRLVCYDMTMTAATYRSAYDSQRFGTVGIYQFMDGYANTRYTWSDRLPRSSGGNRRCREWYPYDRESYRNCVRSYHSDY